MFIVCGFPRSRTKWFSEFLTHGNVVCRHEPEFKNYVELFKYVKEGKTSISDSSLILTCAELAFLRPSMKFLLIKRPRKDVETSLAAVGLKIDKWALDLAERNMGKLERYKKCLTVDYADINNRHKEIFQYLMGYECPNEKSALIDKNIQLSQAEINNIIKKLNNTKV